MNNITIYVADDDEDDRLLLRDAIREVDATIEIVEAENGRDLLTYMENERPSLSGLILLDMNMPRMNGLETVAAIRANPHLAIMPTVMITTSSDPLLALKAYEAGVTHFLTKPQTFGGFVDMAHLLLASHLPPRTRMI